MSETVIVALITRAAPTASCDRGADSELPRVALIDARFASFLNSMDSGFSSFERALDNLQADSKEQGPGRALCFGPGLAFWHG